MSYSYLNVLGLFKVRCGWLSDQMLHRSLSTLYAVWGKGLCFNKYLRGGAVWKSMHWDDEYYSQGPGIVCGYQTV